MSLIVLPRNDSSETAAEACTRLLEQIRDPLTVLMLVFGDGPDVEAVLEICVARASTKGLVRRVVWIPDPEVLSPDLKRDFLRAGKVAVVVGLDDKVAETLTVARAKARFSVERAFLVAEGQAE